jgi:hypothetical protein
MNIYTIGDNSESELSQLFFFFLGRRLTPSQEKRLKTIIYIDDYVFSFPYHLSKDEYKSYLDKVKKMANKYRWSTEIIVKLLLEPSRAMTGWYDNGGEKIDKRQWKRIQEWEMIT